MIGGINYKRLIFQTVFSKNLPLTIFKRSENSIEEWTGRIRILRTEGAIVGSRGTDPPLTTALVAARGDLLLFKSVRRLVVIVKAVVDTITY